MVNGLVGSCFSGPQHPSVNPVTKPTQKKGAEKYQMRIQSVGIFSHSFGEYGLMGFSARCSRLRIGFDYIFSDPLDLRHDVY